MRLCFSGLSFLIAVGCQSEGKASTSQTAQSGDTIATEQSPAKQLVLRARAFDRADNLDSARLLYDEAARAVPELRDWLYLRAAGVTRAKSERDRYLSRIELPPARDRRAPTEAIALERSGDVEGAIAAYTVLGDRFAAIRLRMLRPDDSVRMGEARKGLVAFLAETPGGQSARDAIALFDKTYPNQSAAEHLTLARAAHASGLAARATSGYGKAFAARLGTSRDRFNNGLMLARLDRDEQAMNEFARVSSPAPLAAAARYQRARAMLALGRREQARTALREITTAYPGDTSAASALLLLSDLASDDSRDADARSTLKSLAGRFPNARHAPVALFRAGLMAYVAGDYRSAAADLDSVVRRYPRGDDALAAAYWSGRAWAARGDSAQANARWRQLLAKEGGSYYSVLSSRRLRTPLLADNSRENNHPSVPEVESAVKRIALLRDFGMDTEMRFEQDWLYREAGKTPQRLVATAHAFSGTDQASRAITLGRRAVETLGPSAQNYRLLHPIVEKETLIRSSRAYGLDPILVAALIKQESSFNPRATSPVGARGVMQLMPSVGRSIARSRGIAGYTDESLYDPKINIQLGTQHLAALFRRTQRVERVLAAYNAGESRVARWIRKPGANDPELFTERIPFVETRDYVRAVIRNRAFYDVLYDWN